MSKRMAVICFVSYEIHPTTAGGCGVLIHHAADRLLRDGHDVVLLLDCSQGIFAKFRDKDRLTFAVPDRVRCYRVDDLCPASLAKPTTVFQRKSPRFATALRAVLEREHVDLVEFFEYCGPAFYALAERLSPNTPVTRRSARCSPAASMARSKSSTGTATVWSPTVTSSCSTASSAAPSPWLRPCSSPR